MEKRWGRQYPSSFAVVDVAEESGSRTPLSEAVVYHLHSCVSGLLQRDLAASTFPPLRDLLVLKLTAMAWLDREANRPEQYHSDNTAHRRQRDANHDRFVLTIFHPFGRVLHGKLTSGTRYSNPLLSPNGELVIAFSKSDPVVWPIKSPTTILTEALQTENFVLEIHPEKPQQ